MDEPFEYIVAQDLDHAWLNFEPDAPLPPLPDGRPNPFYVTRPDDVMAWLKKAILLPYRQLPKHFLSGHRGCGKSTELYRLAADPEVQHKFWPVHFSIREHADIDDLDYKDVLLLIGLQLFQQYQAKGGKLPKDLLEELESWQGEFVVHITSLQSGRMEGEVGAKLSAGLAEISSKIKLEPKTRHEIRREIERNITGLIAIINNIAAAIQAREKKAPLVLIDDLDKLDLKIAHEIFSERLELMLRPNCSIVYTVSSPLFYDSRITGIGGKAHFLPNIKLHEQGKRQARYPQGYYTLAQFVHQRMAPELINEQALELAMTMSGGVFRELARLIRHSILLSNRSIISEADVKGAVAELRSTYWRILTTEERALLRTVRQHNQMLDRDDLAPLLQSLAVLEYRNDVIWCDIHPVLHELLDSLPEEPPTATP